MNYFDYMDVEKLNDETALHYTNIKNLESISKKGLQARIGKNSKVIEKSKKVFFSVGTKGALVIMDTWLKWLVARPISNVIYYIGAFLLKVPFFPKIIHKVIIRLNKNRVKYRWAYKKLKKILDNSVYLVLDLEENIDFHYNDFDEVKKYNHYPQSILKDVYAIDSDVLDPKMEYWNMHTISNETIEPRKIRILKFNDEICASIILKYLIEENADFVKDKCRLLHQYYEYIYLNKR